MAETRQFRKRTVAIGPSQGEQEEANESLDSSSRRGLHLRLVVKSHYLSDLSEEEEVNESLDSSSRRGLHLRLVVKSHYLSDLSLDTIVTRRCRVYLCVP